MILGMSFKEEMKQTKMMMTYQNVILFLISIFLLTFVGSQFNVYNLLIQILTLNKYLGRVICWMKYNTSMYIEI